LKPIVRRICTLIICQFVLMGVGCDDASNTFFSKPTTETPSVPLPVDTTAPPLVHHTTCAEYKAKKKECSEEFSIALTQDPPAESAHPTPTRFTLHARCELFGSQRNALQTCIDLDCAEFAQCTVAFMDQDWQPGEDPDLCSAAAKRATHTCGGYLADLLHPPPALTAPGEPTPPRATFSWDAQNLSDQCLSDQKSKRIVANCMNLECEEFLDCMIKLVPLINTSAKSP